MNITTLRFLKRIQINQFEPEELEVTAVLAEGENPEQAIVQLKALVTRGLNGDITGAGVSLSSPAKKEEVQTRTVVDSHAGATATINLTPEAASASVKAAKAAPRTRAAKAAKEETIEGQAVPPVIQEASAEVTPSEKPAGTSPVAGSVDRANVTTVQPEVSKTPASLGKNIVAYDSTVKEHRSRFATYLAQAFPNWKPEKKFPTDLKKQEEYKEQVRTFSLGLHGKAFEDNQGNMLDAFKTEISNFFGK